MNLLREPVMALTFGAGRTNAHGQMVRFDPPPVESFAALLRERPAAIEAWVSLHRWRNDKRLQEGWLASVGIGLDADYEGGESPPPEVVKRLEDAARAGQIPGNIFHVTPHGLRIFIVYAAACGDRAMQVAAEKGAAEIVQAALIAAGLGAYVVDKHCVGDLARFLYTPRSIAKGVARDAEVVVMDTTTGVPAQFAAAAPQAAPPHAAARVLRSATKFSRTFEEAVVNWNADNRREYPRHSGPCPVCGDKGSFGHLPNDPSRWHCFSSDHPEQVGVRGAQGYHGDALDLEAFERGMKHADVLRRDGYLPPWEARHAPKPPPRTNGPPPPGDAPSGAAVGGTRPPFRPWRARSYLTAVQIVGANARSVLGQNARLELNEMTGRGELNRRSLADIDVSRIRSEIEGRFVGGVDKNNNEIGLALSEGDLFRALEQVAADHPYHPVREYLAGIAWDSTERVDSMAEDILNAARTPLNQTLVRRFMVSAVARVFDPGCKVDTMLVLVGPQGCGKSTFLRVLAGPWLVDTAVDIHDKDSFQVLRGALIYEWAELDVLRRARDAEAVKAFITSPVDTYRPPYGRLVVDVPRSGIIAGTTNNMEFLTDDENRRFWPIVVGLINIAILRQQRDQLWGEAVAIYQRWVAAGKHEEDTPWVLTLDESAQLCTRHEEHTVTDAWSATVLGWCERQLVDFTTADILLDALAKPKGQWTRADEMRVASIMKHTGWKLGRKPRAGSRVWTRK